MPLPSFSLRAVLAARTISLLTVAAALAVAACTAERQSTEPSLSAARRNVAPSTLIGSLFINEVESNLGDPGDWIELYNAGAEPIDVSGFLYKDDNDGRTSRIAAGTIIAPGGFLVLEEGRDFSWGLGAADNVRLYGADGTTLIDRFDWTAHASTTYARCPDGSPAWSTATTITKGSANVCAAPIRINEVESSGGDPGDWIELYNAGPVATDLSGWIVRDNNNSNTYVIPSGTTIAAGGYLVLEEAQFRFGLGAPDQVRLFSSDNTILLDSYSWTTHATTTYGRCPNGTGAFATTSEPTRGMANRCPGDIVFSTWPGAVTIRTVDQANTFGSNMSGLSLQPVAGQPAGVLWAVKNGPGTLYRLTFLNGLWTPNSSRTWIGGKALRYPDGTGDVDAEGLLVRGSWAYAAAERNNATSGTSRNSILRYNVSTAAGATLTAVREWNLTADLPVLGANLGLEGITFVPDAYLVASGFLDERTNRPYSPAEYPNHEGGLFFVGVEGNGMVYAYALDHVAGTFARVASFAGGFSGAMEVAFDADLGQLWVVCDDTCQGRTTVHAIDTRVDSPTRGRFVITARFERPAGMPNTNNEGFTFGPLSSCVGGQRPAIWADDNQLGGFALRQGTVSCARF